MNPQAQLYLCNFDISTRSIGRQKSVENGWKIDVDSVSNQRWKIDCARWAEFYHMAYFVTTVYALLF